jgi:hypothetical protein
MIQSSEIIKDLSAAALCLSAYPGIFSGLSNDGKQSPALLLRHKPVSTYYRPTRIFGGNRPVATFLYTIFFFKTYEDPAQGFTFVFKIFLQKPPVFMPGYIVNRAMNQFSKHNFYHS